MNIDELQTRCRHLEEENKKLKNEIKELKQRFNILDEAFNESRLEALQSEQAWIGTGYDLNQNSTNQEKIELFLSLFKGRNDVVAKRWRNKPGYSPYCFNDFIPGVCYKPKIKCSDCKNSAFAKLDEEQIEKHLRGEHVLGLYPLTKEDTCFLLVMDFDKATWMEDIKLIRELCAELMIPVYAERSRSGNGCHLWFFFEHEMKASLARKFAMTILNLAMQRRSSIQFDSYDRLFPSQDFLQKDGFGNLIALPLQKEARSNHNTVFIDDTFMEIKDQWHYLSQVRKLNETFVLSIIDHDQVIETESNQESLFDSKLKLEQSDFSKELVFVKNRGIHIQKAGMSAKGLYILRKMAAYPNPEYQVKQSMRQSTFGTPRMTVHYHEDNDVIILPRGIEANLIIQLSVSKIDYSVLDERFEGKRLKIEFNGKLTEHQEMAFKKLSEHDMGVLSATTGFGKTVIGARMIAERQVPSLILVHTKELALQWKERLEQFLVIQETLNRKRNASIIGQLGGGKKCLNGIVDIAIMQSMFEKDKEVKDIVQNYGLVIVDECHHVSAVNFSRVLGAVKAKYVYGLTATPYRSDGHHPIIFMQCGPIRFQVDAKKEASHRTFDHLIVPRFTAVRMPLDTRSKKWHITDIYTHICESDLRNRQIVADVERVVNDGRNPLILTERTQHIRQLVELMKDKDFEVIVLTGELKTKVRRLALDRIRSLRDGDRFVIIATGKLIGEGFDEARLDTLFLAMPIAWKGTIAQYAGRLHRDYAGKDEVLIYDYVDIHIPVLERMYHKRLSAYRSVGYKVKTSIESSQVEDVIYSDKDYLESVRMDITNAKKHIVISSPYLQKSKLDKVGPLLMERFASGTHISLYTNVFEDTENKQLMIISNLLYKFIDYGIDVIQIKQNRYNFMIVDQSIVWYGDLSILGGSYGEGSMIRIQNEMLGHELMGAISDLD